MKTKYNFFILKNNLIIFFFSVYFIFSYFVPWLLLNEPTAICSNFILIKNISNDSCLKLQSSYYMKAIELSVLWLLLLIFSVKLLLKIKFSFLEKLLNKNLKKICIINISHYQFIFIIIVTNVFVFSSFFISIPNFGFLIQVFQFLHLFFIFYFFKKKYYLFFFLHICILLPSIYLGEISKILFIIITLNLYYLLKKEKVSLFYLIRISSIFFILLIVLLKTQRSFIENYGYSSSHKALTFQLNLNSGESLLYKNNINKEFKIKKNYFDIESFNDILYVKKLEDSFISPFSKTSNNNFDYQRSLSRISELKNTAFVIYLIDNNYVDTLDGFTYQKIPFLFIPRILYSNKPQENFGNILSCVYGVGWIDYENREDCISKNETSVNLNIFLEGYINFKYLGLFLTSFIMAALLRAVIFLINNKNSALNYFSFCLFFQLIQYSSNLSGVLGGLIICLFILTIVIPLKIFNE